MHKKHIAMSKIATNFQKRAMSFLYRGKEIFKPLNTGHIDDHVSCIREWVANIFFYTKDGTTIMIDAGYNYLKEKMGWMDINPDDIKDIRTPIMSEHWNATAMVCCVMLRSISAKSRTDISRVKPPVV